MIQIQLRRRTAIVAAVAFVLIAAVATTSLVVTLTRTAGAGGIFSDTPPWIEDEADWLFTNGIANGYPDGTFRPNQNITRGQAAFWFANYNNSAVEFVSQQNFLMGTRTSVSGVAACPSGKRAVGGGGTLNHDDMYVTDSQPYEPSGSSNWLVRWESEDNVARDPTFMETWALCIPETIP